MEDDIGREEPLVPVRGWNRDQRVPARGPTAAAACADPLVPVPDTNRDQRSQ